MRPIGRRHFLQFAASALAALGMSQLEVRKQGWRYAKMLASPTSRKLALLVGANGYPENPLYGCINDVLLQRELLIHRFGFQPEDILTVTDETEIKPTREGVLQAFEQHLIQQAKPSDVVVFHFSGHGSQVVDPNSPFRNQLNSTFVPLNRQVSQSSDRFVVSDIMGKSLFLLMSALPTENVTVILDSCHSGGGKRGNLTIRSIVGGNDTYRSESEREYQEKWQKQLKMSDEELHRQRQQGIAKGIVIASAAQDQLAADTPFDGFHAGAFTYALTQYLWQMAGSESVSNSIANISRSTTKISTTRQIPEYEVQPNTNYENKPTYFINLDTPPAEAVVTQMESDRVQFWMGGIGARSFAAFNQDAMFSLLDRQGKKVGTLKMASRDGLVGSGTLIENSRNQGSPQSGLFLQEQVRAIPKDFALHIALDPSLGEDIRSYTIQKLSQIARVKFFELGETEIHYILGRMDEEKAREARNQNIQETPEIGSIGLYGQGLDFIPGSFGPANEDVPHAMERLQAKFKSLLAARLVKLTLNASSSRTKVSATMRVVGSQGKEAIAAQEFTPRGTIQKEDINESTANPSLDQIEFENGIPLLPIGTRVNLDIQNQEQGDLYITVIVITPEGDMFVIFPNSWTASEAAAIVEAGETRTIPNQARGDQFQLTVGKPLGTAEVLVLASAAPLSKALKRLQKIARSRGMRKGPVALQEDAPGAIEELLEDLNRGTRSLYATPTTRTVDTSRLAAMSITFRAIEAP